MKTLLAAATAVIALSALPAQATPLTAIAAVAGPNVTTSTSSSANTSSGALAGSNSGAFLSNENTSGSTGSVNNKTGDTKAFGFALGQAATAAQGCLKGNKFAFGLLEWTDHSSKCALYLAALTAETAASVAPDEQVANYYYIRANELMLKAEGLE